MYMAIVVEETVSGFHRETLWYGGDDHRCYEGLV